MSDGAVGLPEAVSMAVGGMVGGGIFAVLGVVAGAASTLAWFAFVVAGVIAACAGYSFNRLNALTEEPSGPITFVERFTGRTKLAGMTGWTFIFGYIGTMAMYAFAFGGYFTELVSTHSVAGLPLRPVVSVVVVAVFVGLNVAGAHASGRTEDVLVALKVAILLLFGLGGLYYGFTHGRIESGLAEFGVGPLVAAAISFVAFEGWELLMFDQDSIADPERTVRRAIYISIATATSLYVVVAVVTTNLVSAQAIKQHAETALAIAAQPFLGQVGFVLISLAALFSTGSAINATLFSASRLSTHLATEDFLPNAIKRGGDEPVRALLVLGALTAAFTFFGSLDGITSFASLAFISIFGLVSALAFRERSDSAVTAAVPAVGALGAAATVVALLWHLYSAERHVFVVVVAIAVAVVGVELLYFDREPIVDEL
ncbi:MAG: APC family permease, partial [Haloferacaceae archaeon]